MSGTFRKLVTGLLSACIGLSLGACQARAQQEVTIRQLNTLPTAGIEVIKAKGAAVTAADMAANIRSPFATTANNADPAKMVTITGVVLSDPRYSGLSSVSNGTVSRIHFFVRDVTAAIDGPAGNDLQVVDGNYVANGTLGLRVGDVVRMTGNLAYFGTGVQFSSLSVQALGTYTDRGLPASILDPVTVTIDQLNMVTGDLKIRLNWDNLSALNQQYVRIENVQVWQSPNRTDSRPNWAVRDLATGAIIQNDDMSLAYRNDKSDYTSEFFATNNFIAPPIGANVNVQGFALLRASSDPFQIGDPPAAVLKIVPWTPADLRNPTWSVALHVEDASGNNVDLKAGAETGASDEYEPGIDLLAPPPPPADSFDGRFRGVSDDYLADLRAPGATEYTWTLLFQPDTAPITISWDPQALPLDGSFRLKDPMGGILVHVDMRTVSSVVPPGGLTQLLLVYRTTEQMDRDVVAGWNLVGASLSASDMHYKALFPTALDNTFYRFSGRYVAPAPPLFSPGEGYWLRFAAAETVTLEGIAEKSLVIGLRSGWNLISGPHCTLASTAIQDPSSIVLAGTLFEFDRRYRLTTGFVPGHGYWIRAGSAGTITLDCAAGKGPADDVDPVLASFGTLRIEDASGGSSALRFGGSLPAGTSDLAYTVPPLVPGTEWSPSFAGGRYATDQPDESISLVGAPLPITVSADRPVTITAIAVDGTVLAKYGFGAGASAVVGDPTIAELRLSGSNDVPTEFRLEPAYPNPFNPTTTLRFTLPEAGPVRLEVFDSIGRRVATLLDRESMPAGLHMIRFDARELPSGVYLARIYAGSVRAVERIILAK